jgi:hypothetical protein
MIWLDVRPDAIPLALRALPCVVWRAEPRGEGKPSKVPYQIACPSRRASSTDPATWGTFADAVDAYSCPELRLAGVGVVLTREAGISCLDLDAVIDEAGALDPRASVIVTRYDSWTERSPSGTGLHIFAFGSVPTAIKGEQYEVYSTGRYIAITGHRWPGTPDRLRARQSTLTGLYRHVHEGDAPRAAYHGPSGPPPDDLAGALLAKLHAWSVPVARLKPWGDGSLVELVACPWADEHTSGPEGAVVMIHASGAYDFMCQHAHCAGRRWREFRAAMESQA